MLSLTPTLPPCPQREREGFAHACSRFGWEALGLTQEELRSGAAGVVSGLRSLFPFSCLWWGSGFVPEATGAMQMLPLPCPLPWIHLGSEGPQVLGLVKTLPRVCKCSRRARAPWKPMKMMPFLLPVT